MTPETPDPPPVSPDPVQVDLHRAVDYYVPRGDVRTLKGEIDRARAADALRHQQEIAAKDHEIAGLKSDVAFKDSLIWTSRESELYKATVAAEKDAKAARAERDAAQQQIDELRQARDEANEVIARYGFNGAKLEVLKLEQQIATLTEALTKLVDGAVSTRAIADDRYDGTKRYGHNPSWVKAADVSAALQSTRPQEQP